MDGDVPQSTLRSLGLGGMQILSDKEGLEIRGLGGSAATMGLSMVAGLLIEPSTKSFVFGSDVNAAAACAEIVCLAQDPVATHSTLSQVGLELIVNTTSSVYHGVLIGGAGGSGFASSH
jgi:hypothetical protein